MTVARLLDTVGLGGRNRPGDVRLVQTLLNRSRMPGVAPLRVDGLVGPATLAALSAFQSRRVGMRRPDRLVEPGRATFRRLRSPHGARSSAEGAPHGEPGGASAARREGGEDGGDRPPPAATEEVREARRDFVRPGVRETALTRKIIDGIAPSFRGVRAKVISGYMNDEELFWKVNYHWDYLLWMVEHAAGLPLTRRQASTLEGLRASLRSCEPRPATGYRTSPVGKPKDSSSMDEMTRRHRVVAQSKRAFKALVREADLKRKSSRTAKAFDYAVAPVAHPGTSKHGTGYALDIAGDNHRISDLCRRLGASLVFDEKSHVHVEFRNGVVGG